MTQEELDALMAGELEDEVTSLIDEDETLDNVDDELATEALEDTLNDVLEESDLSTDDMETLSEEPQEMDEELSDDEKMTIEVPVYDPANSWPPPPPTNEHKVVDQLDDVTKDSEAKATAIFDKLEEITNEIADAEDFANQLAQIFQNNIALMEKLTQKFPNVSSFQEALLENSNAQSSVDGIIEKSQNASDEIMNIMDMMQYQDIHRQKIERVINVMRALSKYMNSLFESDVDDSHRVKAANHIDGDSGEVVSEDDIEALLESFGKK